MVRFVYYFLGLLRVSVVSTVRLPAAETGRTARQAFSLYINCLASHLVKVLIAFVRRKSYTGKKGFTGSLIGWHGTISQIDLFQNRNLGQNAAYRVLGG